jgi:hypothetical protein
VTPLRRGSATPSPRHAVTSFPPWPRTTRTMKGRKQGGENFLAITIPFLRVLGVLAPCIFSPLCLGGECLFFSIVNGPVTHLRRPTNDGRRTRMYSRVRHPSAVLRLTSNVFRLTFLPDLPVGLPLVSLCLGGKCLFFSIVNGPVTHLRRPTNDGRRPRMYSRVRRPSTVCRPPSYVSRLTSFV